MINHRHATGTHAALPDQPSKAERGHPMLQPGSEEWIMLAGDPAVSTERSAVGTAVAVMPDVPAGTRCLTVDLDAATARQMIAANGLPRTTCTSVPQRACITARLMAPEGGLGQRPSTDWKHPIIYPLAIRYHRVRIWLRTLKRTSAS